jgi:hypothetical protein
VVDMGRHGSGIASVSQTEPDFSRAVRRARDTRASPPDHELRGLRPSVRLRVTGLPGGWWQPLVSFERREL